MFSLFNFSSIFPGGQLTQFAPMCGRPWARLKEIGTRWNQGVPLFFKGRSFTSVFIFVPSRYALNRTVLCIIMLHRATETRQTLNTKAIVKALANYPATNANKSTYTVISCRHISTRQNVYKTSWATADVQLTTRLRCARQYPTIYARTNR